MFLSNNKLVSKKSNQRLVGPNYLTNQVGKVFITGEKKKSIVPHESWYNVFNLDQVNAFRRIIPTSNEGIYTFNTDGLTSDHVSILAKQYDGKVYFVANDSYTRKKAFDETGKRSAITELTGMSKFLSQPSEIGRAHV